MDFATVTKAFFDTKAVTDRLDPATRKALSKFGAFVRQRDKSSLKYKDGTAPPGQPPFVHRSTGYTKSRKNKKTGLTKTEQASPLRELIFFAYDANTKSVVIGPVLGGSQSGAPRTIEEGGNATVRRENGKVVSVHVRPHPHTKPAFDTELGKVGGNFRNIL